MVFLRPRDNRRGDLEAFNRSLDLPSIAAESTLLDCLLAGMEDEICPYATFHLLGFREEMDPSKAMQFQTFPHPGNGHSGTMGPPVGHPTNASAHSRSGSQSMVSSSSFSARTKGSPRCRGEHS